MVYQSRQDDEVLPLRSICANRDFVNSQREMESGDKEASDDIPGIYKKDSDGIYTCE